MTYKVLLFMFGLTLAGCGIGGQYMNGLPPSKMKSYVPPRDYWGAEHASVEQRERLD